MLKEGLIHIPPEFQKNALQAVWMDGARTGFVAGCLLCVLVWLWRYTKNG